MSQGNRQNRQFALTYDQRLLLDMYINFYNHTTRQMDALYDLQSEIRGHINQIIGLSHIHNHSNNSNNSTNSNNSNRNFNESFASNRQQNTSSRRSNNNNRTQYGRDYPDIGERSSNSRVVYIEGVPYLLDLTNFMRIRNTNTNNTDAANLWRSFYENITVAPTREQVENSTRIVQFSEITTPINSSCPITLERFDENSSVTQILHCGHIFTPTGIDSWFQSNVRCPVCRYDIRDYRVPPPPATTREERHRWTDPGNDEETKEEETLEETKEDTYSNTSNSLNERRSNSNRQNANQRSRRITSENVTNVLSNITEEIINNIFNPNGNGARSLFDQSQNSLFYDSSNNQFIFEGFIRR